jgi:hypothetical protein
MNFYLKFENNPVLRHAGLESFGSSAPFGNRAASNSWEIRAGIGLALTVVVMINGFPEITIIGKCYEA